MSILHISGSITVEVDQVDIEQTVLERPATCSGFPLYVKAMIAALRMEDVISFSNQIEKQGFMLEYRYGRIDNDGNIFITFDILERKNGHADQ